MLQLFLVCLTAGLAAGIGTGFAGLSAATVIAPMLIAFLGFPWYESVGIGLASDVLASALAAWIYKKHGNIDLKNGSFMLASVLAMTVAGSYFSQYMPDMEMGYLSIIMSFCMGLRFIIKPVIGRTSFFSRSTGKRKTVISVICGLCIGFYCGFMGLGGGMMMLFVLTFVLGYDLKTAVGTSVFVMTFTAFTGAASHFYFGELTGGMVPALFLCAAFTLLGSVVTSAMSNRMKPENTNRATGVVLVILGIAMIFEQIV